MGNIQLSFSMLHLKRSMLGKKSIFVTFPRKPVFILLDLHGLLNPICCEEYGNVTYLLTAVFIIHAQRLFCFLANFYSTFQNIAVYALFSNFSLIKQTIFFSKK